MIPRTRHDSVGERLDEALEAIRLPLENVEFTIEQYLLQNGARLDTDTRLFLAGVRDCIGRAAVSTRRLTRSADPEQVPVITRRAS